jgi:transcriptional regulator with XRE-family HTH domain
MAKSGELLAAFGARMRTLRKARGWTQEELARRTDRHWTYIGGLERGERNPTLVVISEIAAALTVSPRELVDEHHPLCTKLSAAESDILDAIESGFRAQVDVKGKLAELYMNRQFEALNACGAIAGVVWQDSDGKPDFLVSYSGCDIVVECKNIRNESYTRPPSYKVELQRTRNSKDGTPTRGYKTDEFDVLGVALFNQAGRWDYLYVATKRLDRRPNMPEFLKVMQRVPMEPTEHWTSDPLRAFDDAIGA